MRKVHGKVRTLMEVGNVFASKGQDKGRNSDEMKGI